jgi:ribonuclease VapC
VIAVDTSALIAIVFREAEEARCRAALAEEEHLLISAGTLAEALIVAERRGSAAEVAALVEGLGFHVETVTAATARDAAAAYARWGKGFSPAGLNFGDCFAYVLAKAKGCPLLYIGDDFARTDIASVL